VNLGKVTGTLVSSHKEPLMEGLALLVVRQLDETGAAHGGYVIAVDSVGAGVGEIVLYASGSSARQTDVTRDKPCDAVIMAIVDQWDVDGETVYVK
jgi:microcompartment protein CcmK/EutM